MWLVRSRLTGKPHSLRSSLPTPKKVRKTRKMSKKDAYDLKNCCESIAYR